MPMIVTVDAVIKEMKVEGIDISNFLVDKSLNTKKNTATSAISE